MVLSRAKIKHYGAKLADMRNLVSVQTEFVDNFWGNC